MFSSFYENLALKKFPIEDIVSATSNFSDANLIRESAIGKVYRLLESERPTDLVAQRSDRKDGQGNFLFWKEISMLSSLKHENLVSIVGFCDEKNEKIIVYKHEANGSLDDFLSDPKLTWLQRLQICVGVSHALSYMQYDKQHGFRVVHGDIRSSNILLDDNWKAKLSGFELSVTQSTQRNHLCLTDGSGMPGYRDPYAKSGIVTHQSDMYSFGVVLFEVLCAVIVNGENKFLAPLAKSHYEERRLDDLIDPGLRKQMDPQSFKIFSEIAYCCLKELSQRPNINQIVKRLEEALEAQRKHEDPWKDLKHLQIPLTDIEVATEKFTKTIIGEGSFGQVYKAELDHFDGKKNLSLEEKNKAKAGKKRSIVAIKRILLREDKQGEVGFFAEIEMLTRCHHPNVVTLLGFCKEDGHMILVYEYVSKGSLQDYLLSTDKPTTLSWVQRIKICIDIARGLNYLHTEEKKKPRIIHRDVKSGNILLGENWEVKIADFGLSKFGPENPQKNSTLYTQIAGTSVYLDPEYHRTNKLKTGTDIYSFGVVLFEILSGRLANDEIYTKEHIRGIAPVARQRINDKKLKDIVDSRLWGATQDHDNSSTMTKGIDQYSLHAFLEIAYQCVEETQAKRPTAELIIKKLQDALSLQETTLKHLEIPLTDIKLATHNFSYENIIVRGAYSEVYKAELDHFDSNSFFSFKANKTKGTELPKRRSTVAVECILITGYKVLAEQEQGILAEIGKLSSYKHRNITSLLGFNREEDDTLILVYEHASNESLESYLEGRSGNLINLTWMQRLKICIGIASGLKYLHTEVEGKPSIIIGQLSSQSIKLDKNLEVKIKADYSLLSKLSTMYQQARSINSQIHTNNFFHNSRLWDSSKKNMETDIYSFGVTLLEIMSGKVAFASIYLKENSQGIAPVALRRFNDGTIKEMLDPRLKEDTISALSKGPDEDSLDAFLEIAYQCLAECPSAEAILQKLEEALSFQENSKDKHQIPFGDIVLATQVFSNNNLIGRGRSGSVYKGEFESNIIAAKRLDKIDDLGENKFLVELEILLEYKHENIIGLVGYCNKNGENIGVYEYASNRSLDKHLKENGLTWMQRLHICIGIASGLDFLHGGSATQEVVIHRDLKSSNILLNDDWKAKICGFGLSLTSPINKQMEFVFNNNVCGTEGYYDPLYDELGFLTKESDIYSLGVILFEILCGRLALDYNYLDTRLSLPLLVKHNNSEGKLDEMVFEGIRAQTAPDSLTTFQNIAYQCLNDEREKRPIASEVLLRLKKALEFQEDYDIWETKLPHDYQKLIRMSNFAVNLVENKKEIYNMLSEGILLQKDEMFFSLGAGGERNVRISAKRFSYINRCPHTWRYVRESRFPIVAEMLDISNLNIRIKTRPQLLSKDVVYGVYFVFNFSHPRKVSSKPLYVNLKYLNGSKTSHAYFATRRDDGWMMIELCRFLNHGEDIVFKFLLLSLSRYYCGDGAIYVEGIEFRPIENVKHEEIKEMKEVQQFLNNDQVQQLPTNPEEIVKRSTHDDDGEKMFLQREVNGKKYGLLSAKAAFDNSHNVNLFKTKPSTHSRFPEEIELLRQQVFRIKCKINSQTLSRDTDYVCYLVFKLSEKCRGLHCPVRVRDLHDWNNKEVENIYFRSPSPWNLQDTIRAPEQRADGWIEVKVWKFNFNRELNNDHLRVNLKLISYEGTMSGLIISGLEFRPV